ncbi:MAG: ribosomal protein S18-alanine N-acetyltransferase [Anaerolineales bacterium]
MNPQPNIRRMTFADLDAVVALDRLSFSDPWPYSAWREMLEAPHARVWIVEISGVAASGVLSATQAHIANERQIIGALAIWLILEELHIGTIAVHPDYRQKGIGTILLEKGLREGIAEGGKVAHLEVRKSNVSAQRLYARFGFRIVGERKRYYSDNHEDALLMSVYDLGEAYLRWLNGEWKGTW